MPNFYNPTLGGTQLPQNFWGSDEELEAKLPITPFDEYLKQRSEPPKPPLPLVDSLSNGARPPMFSGPGDMADRRLAVLERTDPEAAAALRQQLAKVQAQHQVEMQYNALHDQARTPTHYGRDVDVDGGPIPHSDVERLVAKQKEQEYLTGNPGMRRFLGGRPVQDAPAKFPLMEALTEGVRRDNEREYGTVGGRRASRPVGSNTWAIERRSMSELRPDEIKAIDNAPSPETLRQNGERYKEHQKARHDQFQAKKDAKAQMQYALAMEQAKGGGITGDQMDYALRVAQQNPAMMPLLRSFIEGRSGVAAAQAQATGRGDAQDWHGQHLQAQLEQAKLERQLQHIDMMIGMEQDPAKKQALLAQRGQIAGIPQANVPIPAPLEPGASLRALKPFIDPAHEQRQQRLSQMQDQYEAESDPLRKRQIMQDIEDEAKSQMYQSPAFWGGGLPSS